MTMSRVFLLTLLFTVLLAFEGLVAAKVLTREKFLSDRQKRKRELVALKKHIVEQVDAHHSKKKTVEEKRLSSLLKRAGSYQEQINEFSKTLSEEEIETMLRDGDEL